MFWADKIQRRTVLKLPPCSLGFLKTHINTTHPCVPWVTKRGQTVLLLYRDRLPRRKITPRLVESSMNVVGLIFVSGEPYLNEFVTRELFSHLFFLCWRCFLSMQLPSGFLYLGNWGWSSPGEENKMMLESPNLSSEEFGFHYLCSVLFCWPGVRTRLGGLQTSALSLPEFQNFLDFADYSPLASQDSLLAFSSSKPQFIEAVKVSASTPFCFKKENLKISGYFSFVRWVAKTRI